MNKVKQIDITPSANIYNTFKNLNYKHVDAIAELIDNSTQSFKDQKNEYEIKVDPEIYIMYFESEDALKILDNCYGIKDENIERILKLNVPTKNENSRNEFGMGLKTSGFWMGNYIEIISSNVKNEDTISIQLDLDKLEEIENNENKIDVNRLPKEVFLRKQILNLEQLLILEKSLKNFLNWNLVNYLKNLHPNIEKILEKIN